MGKQYHCPCREHPLEKVTRENSTSIESLTDWPENSPNPTLAVSTPCCLGPGPTSIPSGSLFSPVSGSLKSGKVIVLSCRLSAMVLSKRLLPRPESLQNTATNVSHSEGGRGGKRINQYRLLMRVFDALPHLPIYHKASCFLAPPGAWAGTPFSIQHHKRGLNHTHRPLLALASFVSL